MAYISVVPAEKGKFKVLVNFIQRGISYSTQALAQKEANKIKAEIRENGGTVND